MKLLVPLMIPAIHSIRFAVRPSRSALMIGMPPATAASNATITPAFCAAAKISLPCAARSALLAVTTCLPSAIACSMSERAGSMPPISSSTMSTSGLRTRASTSAFTSTLSVPCNSARAFSGARVAIRVMRIGRPARREISSALRLRTVHVPRPTVPKPSRPTRIGCMATLAIARNANRFGVEVAEAHARRDRDLRLREKLLGELQRAQLAVGFRDPRPDVHRCLGALHHPAGLVQAFHQHVAPLLILHRNLPHALLRALERGDRRDLDRRERTVIVIALDARQRVHQVLVADHESDAPAGHVVALGHGEEFDGDLARARHLHDRGRLPAVEADVG